MGSGDASTSYRVLPIQLGKGSKIVRHLFIKPHAGADSLPKDRTLFITGLPFQLDEGGLLELFSRFGSVERAAVHASKVSAVVLYEAAAGRDAALQAAAKGRVQQLDLPEPSAPFGLKGSHPALAALHPRACKAQSRRAGSPALWRTPGACGPQPCGVASHCAKPSFLPAALCSLGGAAQGSDPRKCGAAAGAGCLDGVI